MLNILAVLLLVKSSKESILKFRSDEFWDRPFTTLLTGYCQIFELIKSIFSYSKAKVQAVTGMGAHLAPSYAHFVPIVSARINGSGRGLNLILLIIVVDFQWPSSSFFHGPPSMTSRTVIRSITASGTSSDFSSFVAGGSVAVGALKYFNSVTAKMSKYCLWNCTVDCKMAY